MIRMTTAEMVEGLGFEVLEAADAARFLALLGDSSGRGMMIVASLCASVTIGADRRSCRVTFDVPAAVSFSC